MAVAKAPQVQPVKPPAPTKAQPPFRWSQLETPDFATYVKNLRGIGCPEPTIRDIIGGELSEIYAQKRQEAAAQNQGSLLEAEALKLQTEKERLLVKLTASSAAEPGTTGTEGTMTRAQTSMVVTQPASGVTAPASQVRDIPAAFTLDANPAAVLTPQNARAAGNAQTASAVINTTASMLTTVKQDFVQAVGDTGDPDSEAYRRRWEQARRHADERFSSMYGGDAFMRAQSQALQQAAAEAATK